MTSGPPERSDRFEPHAVREMAGMFDDVSGRYDALNRLMTLGRDAAWRAAMGALVPWRARVVLDLCTGNGVLLAELLEPGRLVLGMDVSLRMLAHAANAYGQRGWGPRLACADAFRLPLRAHAVDAVTVAFGVRNLRPRRDALREIARVLRPGGALVVLEATAPAPGPLAPLHRFWLTRVVPLLGRLSPDPTAYRYLAESIVEFGDGSAFERDLADAGFDVGVRRSFMLGATRLWAASRPARPGEIVAGGDPSVHIASPTRFDAGDLPHAARAASREWRAWTAAQLVTGVALAAALAWGLASYHNYRSVLPLRPWEQTALEVLLVLGLVMFAVRTLVLLLRILGPAPRR
jgi:demethylmenaquinone methyltransferase/2-methoxy-6-polyprenyl-1,4-benzoquinol methylase